MSLNVLIVDDEPAARFGIARALEREGYIIEEAPDLLSANSILETFTPAVVILDVKLAGESGLDYLPELVSRRYAPVVLVVIVQGNERVAVEAMKKGAFDYVPAPFDLDELRLLATHD